MDDQTERTAARLINDDFMKWPLWLGNAVADDHRLQPISDSLRESLLAWTEFYHDHYHAAWDTDENGIRYNQMGLTVAQRVADELGPSFRVSVQLLQTSQTPQVWIEVPGTTH